VTIKIIRREIKAKSAVDGMKYAAGVKHAKVQMEKYYHEKLGHFLKLQTKEIPLL
jgi:hypothetical protein